MLKNQVSIRDKRENFLCPFTDMYISQGSKGAYSHKGIMANDVRGKIAGICYPYYAPCTVKCLRIFKESGQVMWQSVGEVYFANGRVDYATFMTAHDDSIEVQVGDIIKQGEELGHMGNKGQATGVHCHIQVSQSKDMRWYKNSYGNYQFYHEYDLDDCYFVDNTNIIKGLGGNWKTTKDVLDKETPTNSIEEVRQILPIGSKVKFDGIFKVDILKSPLSSNLFGNTELTGVCYETYFNEKAHSYHWIPLDDFTKVDRYGNSVGKDNIVIGGKSYVLNKNIYTVLDVSAETHSVKLQLNNHIIWVFSEFLYEVE